MTTENPFVAEHAVSPGALPLNELTLIGLFLGGDTPNALVRSAQGEITKVTIGDRIGAQTVIVVSYDTLILAAPDGTHTLLQMPS